MPEVAYSQELNKMLYIKNTMLRAKELPQVCRRCKQLIQIDLNLLIEEIDTFIDNNNGVVI